MLRKAGAAVPSTTGIGGYGFRGSRWRAPRNDKGNPREAAGASSTRLSLRPLISRGTCDDKTRASICRGNAQPHPSAVIPGRASSWREPGIRYSRWWLWIPGLRQVGASRNDDGEACAKRRITERRNISTLAKPAPTGEKTAGQKRQRRAVLTIKGKAYIAGIYEHPTRHAPDKSTAQLHAEVAKGALEDAGLTKADIDGYFCAGDAPGGAWPMVDYLGLKVRHVDSTETGGCSYLIHLGHAAEAIAAGKCSIALITLAGKPRTGAMPPRAAGGRGRFRGGLRRHHAQCLRHVRHAPHARLRHHQRATGLDQGRGLASRAIQPACDCSRTSSPSRTCSTRR